MTDLNLLARHADDLGSRYASLSERLAACPPSVERTRLDHRRREARGDWLSATLAYQKAKHREETR